MRSQACFKTQTVRALRVRSGGTFPPSPSLQGKGCLLVRMTPCGLTSVSGGSGFNSRPFRGGLGRGFPFCSTIPPCQSRISSLVNTSPKKNSNARPLCPAYGGDISPFSKSENGETRREMTPAEKPAKRVARSPREEVGSSVQAATSHSGIHC